jgi:hypothetical protein
VADRELAKADARRLAWHLHDHIPFLIAVSANSPVWADEITSVASNRVVRASRAYFRPIERGEITQRAFDEMLYSPGRKRKPPTLELRVMDSNIPEFVMVVASLVKAAALGWRAGVRASNRIPRSAYLHAREDAALRGMKARLCWNGDWVTVPRYLDRFVWEHRQALGQMDIPEDVWTAFKLLKRKLNGSAVVAEAARRAYDEHPQTWQSRFGRRYVEALDHLLSGHSVVGFLERLHVSVPELEPVWIGRRNLRLP